MVGITILTNSSDFLQKSNNFENIRTLFLVSGILFFIISIVLFIRFDIRQIIFINVKHKQKSIPKAQKPDGLKMKSGEGMKRRKDMTESLEEETVLLESECDKTEVLEGDRTAVLEGDKTEVLEEVQLEFYMEKSVDMYSDDEER